MDMRLFATVFSTIFIAELGDKTQLATLLYAADRSQPITVFLASALALTITSALAVAGGSLITHWVSPKLMRALAGLGFIAVGIWILASGEGAEIP
ncbi:MAG TPA: TMEM165/GDT1 family protein [Vicinamibacteria bacterium]|nr:TMEM165/GDT1 family protein [Vicinamibacteria bacterium]